MFLPGESQERGSLVGCRLWGRTELDWLKWLSSSSSRRTAAWGSTPCPSTTLGLHPNPCPLSQWCHPTISSSVIPFSCRQSCPAPGSFPTSWFFTSGGLNGELYNVNSLPNHIIWHTTLYFKMSVKKSIFSPSPICMLPLQCTHNILTVISNWNCIKDPSTLTSFGLAMRLLS